MHRRKRILKNGQYSVIIAVGVTIAALYFGQDVLIPLVLAVLLVFLLAPLCDRLERRIHRVASVILVTVVAFGFIIGLAWTVGRQVITLSNDLPKYKTEILAKVRSFRGTGAGTSAKIEQLADEIKKAAVAPSTQATQPASNEPPRVVPPLIERNAPLGETPEHPIFTQPVPSSTSPLTIVTGYLGLVLGPLATAGIVFVFTFFMLLEREDLRDRILRLMSRGKYTVTTIALDDAAGRISRYLTAQLCVNGTYGLAIGAGLWAIGFFAGKPFPSFVLWGLLCTLLRFIPYLGPWIAASFPVTLSIIVYHGFGPFVATALLFIIIELISNNAIEPWLYGASTGMTTTAVLVSAVFWTWLWGPVGLFLATPLTVCLVVIGKYVNRFEFLDVLLGDQPALDPSMRYYQRLLAKDRDDAIRIVEEYRHEVGVDRVPDDVMIPALRMARRERQLGDLSAEMEDTVFEGTSHILRNVLHQLDADDRAGQPLVLGCAAHHEAEELIVQMLRELLPKARVETVSTRVLPAEIEDRVANEHPAVVYIAILPPGGMTQARYLVRRLRRRFRKLQIVVGYWGRSRNFDRLLARFRSVGARHVATSLAQSRSQIESLLPKTEQPPRRAAPTRPVPGQDRPEVPPEDLEPLGNA
jgi:predicted PurR-regulated permease PerM